MHTVLLAVSYIREYLFFLGYITGYAHSEKKRAAILAP